MTFELASKANRMQLCRRGLAEEGLVPIQPLPSNHEEALLAIRLMSSVGRDWCCIDDNGH